MPSWDERFSEPGFLFGTEPAKFVRSQAHRIRQEDRVLAVADGEGRNSVFVASLGARVTAMDASAVAQDKARVLAAERGVTVDFQLSDIDIWAWEDAAFDVVLGVFIQFSPPEQRARVFAGMAKTLRPGGLLLLHGYAPRQIGYGTGGPPMVENLYTTGLLAEAFPGFEILESRDYDTEVAEGRGHRGLSALVDFVALKPA